MAAPDLQPQTSPGYQRKGGWGRSLLIALITGIVGLVTSAFAANLAIEWYQWPAYEGTGLFFVGPFAFLGLLAGCVAGLVGSLLSRRTGVPAAIMFVASVGAILALVATTAFAARVLADVPPEIDRTAVPDGGTQNATGFPLTGRQVRRRLREAGRDHRITDPETDSSGRHTPPCWALRASRSWPRRIALPEGVT